MWMAMAALAAPQVLAAETGSQASLDRLADTLGYRYTMVDNGPECPAGIDGCFLSTITLTMPENLPADMPAKGLSLYFSFVNRLPLVESDVRSEEHTSELQSLMRISYAVFCLKKKTNHTVTITE